MSESVTLSLNVLGAQALVPALSAADGTNGVSCVAAHANLAVKQASLCFGESCHGVATNLPYLTATTRFGYVEDRRRAGGGMKVVRFPGIHHDGNVVLVSGSLGHVLINAGTSWYQALQVERVTGQLEGQRLDRIFLTSRRFPVSGGAAHLSKAFDGVPVHIHGDGQAALETGDFFTTWANRYDSDMPRTPTEALTEGDVFPMGDGEVVPVHLPGHAGEGMGYHIPHLSTLVVGALLPRADRPTRWDLPGGSLIDVIDSFKRMMDMRLTSIVPLQGPAIRGSEHVLDVLKRHLDFFESAAANDGQPPSSWDRPAPTAVWLTPRTPWPLDETETV